MTRRDLFRWVAAALALHHTPTAQPTNGEWRDRLIVADEPFTAITFKGQPITWDPAVITPDWRQMSVPITVTPDSDGRTDHLVKAYEAWCSTAARNLQDFFDKKLFS